MSCDNVSSKYQLQAAKELRAMIYGDRIKELAGVYGSVRAVGRALNIDHAYLHRLKNGDKANPSNIVLIKLGLL